MKKKLFIAVLAVSMLLNVWAIFCLVDYAKLNGRYKDIKHERDDIVYRLTMMRGAGYEVPGGQDLVRRVYRSHVDGMEDVYAVVPPVAAAPTRGLTLVVYFHGMGSTFMEPYVNPIEEPIAKAIYTKDPSVVFMSVNYRGKASWGNDAAISDINQNIHEVLNQYPIDKIVLVGTSMGGCTVLNYATKADRDIKGMIKGVVSVEGAGDLVALYKEARHPAIEDAMNEAFGGTPEQKPNEYAKTSFFTNIAELPKSVNVAVISAKKDTLVRPHLQRDIVEALNKEGVHVKLIEVDQGHGAPPADVYVAGVEFAKNGG